VNAGSRHPIAPADIDDRALERLLQEVYRQYHYDFRSYAPASLKRRLASALGHFRCATLGALEELMRQDPGAFARLLGYLTVQVSDLFRDPDYFRALREKVVPYLQTYPSLKVWIAGCATGEEAYSTAILLHEEGLLDRTQIYATDINPESLRIAQDGVYSVDRFPAFSESYRAAGGKASLADYYTARYGSGLFDRRLKKAILFSDHSLATDSVFAEVQMVSCRNVLIYFDRRLQERAIGLLRESLCRRGFLGLGTKESLRFSAHGSAFREVVPDQRIYQKL
jgi:chemotaxis protein methyltransferase CheR